MAEEGKFEVALRDKPGEGGRFGVRLRRTGRWLPVKFDTEREAMAAAVSLNQRTD